MKASSQPGTTRVLPFDLLDIGGGLAGASDANRVTLCEHRVLLIEKESEIGRAGIHSGTMPSKTLSETTLARSGWRSRRT